MSTIRYSVIIPHKDIPDLLDRLLHSIPRREDTEVFVVDDNSDPHIMAGYQELEGVHYRYTHESCGAGYARNIALREARGEWLIFADADDYFLPEAFDLFDRHTTDEADIIYFKCSCRYSDTGGTAEREETQLPLLQQFDPADEHTSNRIRYSLIVPWGKMIRRAMVERHGIFFDETKWANDVMFSTRTAYHARLINVDLSQAVYCTTVRRGSLVNQYGRQSLKCRYIVAMRQNRYLREHGLFRYQQPVHDYIRKSTLSGAKVFFEFLRLGHQYNADLFSAFCAWIRDALFSRRPVQQKDTYITYLHQTERKTVEVVAAVIFDAQGRIFATQRGYGDWKDWWEFPGGKIESGETPEEALHREIREELDAGIEVGELLRTIDYDYPAFHLTMHCFKCRLSDGHLTLLEHEAAKWLAPQDLHSVRWLPADEEIILILSLFPTIRNSNS